MNLFWKIRAWFPILLFGILAFTFVGCFGREDWEDKVCIRHLPDVKYIQQKNNPERLLVQAYEKGSSFSKLLYSEHCVLDSTNSMWGKNDTFHYRPYIESNTPFSKNPEVYDWKYTDSATGIVALFTELKVVSNTALAKKLSRDDCHTDYASWKLNGAGGSYLNGSRTVYAIAVMNR